MKNIFYYETKIGKLGIGEKDGEITDISTKQLQGEEIETPFIKEAFEQINEYLSGKRKYFDLPLNFEGTDFQTKVWNSLKEIPYGETRSYKEIAFSIGNGNASRAVGMANNKNPLLIVVPCHRVIGSNGDLTGFAGGLDIKEQLLNMEKENV